MQWRPVVLMMCSVVCATFKGHFCLSCLPLFQRLLRAKRFTKAWSLSHLLSSPEHFSGKGVHICLSRTCKRANDQEAWRSFKGNVPGPSTTTHESVWDVFQANGKDPTVARLKGLKEGSCCWTLIPHIFYGFKQNWRDRVCDWQGVLLRLGHFQNRPPTKCWISTISLSEATGRLAAVRHFQRTHSEMKELNWESEIFKWTINT